LEALAQSNAPASLSELHARTGEGSLSGVRNVLERLVTHGVAVKDPAGYRLNREHVAADAVVALASLHGRFAARVRSWLGERTEKVVAAGILGSMARRDGTPDSDIDLLVVVDDDGQGALLRDELADAVFAWTGNHAQALVLTPAQLAEMRAQQVPLVESWRTDLQMIEGSLAAVVG
jgi:hypothetical protein